MAAVTLAKWAALTIREKLACGPHQTVQDGVLMICPPTPVKPAMLELEHPGDSSFLNKYLDTGNSLGVRRRAARFGAKDMVEPLSSLHQARERRFTMIFRHLRAIDDTRALGPSLYCAIVDQHIDPLTIIAGVDSVHIIKRWMAADQTNGFYGQVRHGRNIDLRSTFRNSV